MVGELLPVELRRVLPALRFNDDGEPFVYAEYAVPDHPWRYFITEGSPTGDDYCVFGFLLCETEEESRWTEYRVSELERLVIDGRHAPVIRNHDFRPGYLTDVVELPPAWNGE